MNRQETTAATNYLPHRTQLVATRDDQQCWMENYRKLAFRKANGQWKMTSGDPFLDAWAWNQQWLQQAGWLSQDRKALLDDLGIIWNNQTRTPPPVSWMDQYNQLLEFKQKHGHSVRAAPT